MVTEGRIQSSPSCVSAPVLIATWSVFASAPQPLLPPVLSVSRSLWWLWCWRPWRQTENSNPFPHAPLKVVPSRMTNVNIAAPNQFHQTPFLPYHFCPYFFFCPWAQCPPSTLGPYVSSSADCIWGSVSFPQRAVIETPWAVWSTQLPFYL